MGMAGQPLMQHPEQDLMQINAHSLQLKTSILLVMDAKQEIRVMEFP